MEYLYFSSLGLLLIIAYVINRYFLSLPENLPPGPKGLPIIGNLHQLGSKPHKSLAEMSKIHGPIISLKLGQVTAVVVSSAKIAREVLQTHDAILSSRSIPDALYVHDHYLVALPWISPSPLWRSMRRICATQLFSTKALDSTLELRRKKARELEKRLRSVAGASKENNGGVATDLGGEAFAATLNMLSKTVFSTDFADPSSELAKEFKEMTWNIMKEAGTPNVADFFPILKRVDPLGIRRRMGQHFGRLLVLFGGIIDKRLELRKSTKERDCDVLDTLLDIVETTQEINSHQMMHLLLVLFVAGTDTTATTVQWAMAELIQNPNMLSKARAELHEVIGKGNPVEESDISRLPYLQAIVKETFRLHPAVPLLLPRKSEAEVEIEGFRIPKGSQILINVWSIGRDPGLWGETDPEAFRPERFLGSEIDVKGRSFELLPFGGGRRICPGLPLAMRIVHLMLGTLIHHFEWRLEGNNENVDMEDKFGITLELAKPLKAIPTFIA